MNGDRSFCLVYKSRSTGFVGKGGAVSLDIAEAHRRDSQKSFGNDFTFTVQPFNEEEPAATVCVAEIDKPTPSVENNDPDIKVSSFRDENGLNTIGLVSSFLSKTDQRGVTLLPLVRKFISERINKEGVEKLSYREAIDIIGSLLGGEGGDFFSFLLYQKMFPETTKEEFAEMIKSERKYPIRVSDRMTGIYLYSLENILGFPNGAFREMFEK